MTPRDQRIAALLGGVLVLLVVGVVGYFFVYAPLQDKAAAADRLAAEVGDQEAKLAKVRKEMPRLATAVQRSLPANVDQSRQEYDAVITQLLRDAKVPRSSLTVKPKAVEGKAAPEVSAKKPAYTRVGLEITLKKVSLATTIDVLKRYYRLNLLQQITKFSVKKSDEARDAPPSAGSLVADRADLDVTLITEAIILDGAETRQSLLPVSTGFAAVGGVAGLATVQNSPGPARGLTPLQLVRTLAATDRDYSLLLVKDVFHGPPPPAAIAVKEVAPPKEDTSAFIRVTGLGRNPDGSGTAVIEDRASKQEYLVDLAWVNATLTPEVTKFYYSIKGAKKSFDAERDLEISEATSGTARKFRVLGFAEDGLVVADLKSSTSPVAAPTPTGTRPRGGPATKVPAVAAVAGGPAATVPAEKVFLWKLGQTLDQVTELTGAARDKAVRFAQGLPPSPDVAPEPRAVENSQ